MSEAKNAPESAPPPAAKPWGMEVNTYCMLLHISQLAGNLVPGAGLIMPIVMWAVNKDQHPAVDRQGKIVMNWIISLVIYCIISAVLIFVFIGIIMICILSLLAIIFAIIGAVKANNGEEWVYPMSIKFFK